MTLLTADVAAVNQAEGESSAVVVGHDWGGGIAWSFAAAYPQMTDRLIIMNLPHVKGLQRELASMGQQHRNSQYARNFQQPDSHENISPSGSAMALSQGDEALREIYLAAFENSSTESMMNYYRRNYPREPYVGGPWAELPRIQAPVLQFHGLNDSALLAPALNNTWEELDQDWTLVTIPGVGHWLHHEKPDMVTNMMRAWLSLVMSKSSIPDHHLRCGWRALLDSGARHLLLKARGPTLMSPLLGKAKLASLSPSAGTPTSQMNILCCSTATRRQAGA